MSRRPDIESFRGDNKQLLPKWIQIFTEQLEVLDIEEENFKQTLFCLCKGKAFTFVSQYMVSCNNANFTEVIETIMEEFCGGDYKRTLETKLQVKKFARESDIPIFSQELKRFFDELDSTEDDKTVELVASNHVVAV